MCLSTRMWVLALVLIANGLKIRLFRKLVTASPGLSCFLLVAFCYNFTDEFHAIAYADGCPSVRMSANCLSCRTVMHSACEINILS